MKKGYLAEYQAKKILIKKYGKNNVFKIAIGGILDFLILSPDSNKIIKIVEIKKTKKNKWYLNDHDKKQIKILKKIKKTHKIPIEYWIKIKNKWYFYEIDEIEKII
ncbi:MAG: hypothetical protein C4278_01785 [Patescibacteria group bacterium]|mgnify:CR=1 FL=1